MPLPYEVREAFDRLRDAMDRHEDCGWRVGELERIVGAGHTAPSQVSIMARLGDLECLVMTMRDEIFELKAQAPIPGQAADDDLRAELETLQSELQKSVRPHEET